MSGVSGSQLKKRR